AARGLQWSTLVQIDVARPFSTGSVIMSMACPTTSLCVGIDYEGNVQTSTNPAGVAWTPATVTGPGRLNNIDCASATQCVAVTGYGELISTTHPSIGAAAWATAKVACQSLSDVACPTESFWTTVGEGGRILTST